MKRLSGIISALSTGLFLLCSSYGTLSEADKPWLLLPQDLPDTLFAGYLPQKNSGGRPFFFKKTKTSLSGFSAVFEQKLTHAQKGTVLYTVQVSYARNETDARALYGNYLTVEERFKNHVKKAEPSDFAADDVLLIHSDRVLYLTIRKNLILYFIQIDNCSVDLEPVKREILRKIDFIERHAAAFRT
ncbi:MAG: hypothetical protein JW768_08430 [Chitinispirillaceae bacterium]|nr:hypothetical protein [Chitinispirillaceae bacterium]